MARKQNICINNMKEIIRNLFSLGFIIYPEKTLFTSTQALELLRFVINSSTMTICFMEPKKQAIHNFCLTALNIGEIKTRFLANILGKFSSNFIGAPQGLKVHKGNYEK